MKISRKSLSKISRRRLIGITGIGAVVAITAMMVGASSPREVGRLPVDWFVAPEDRTAFLAADDARDDVDNDQQDGMLFKRSTDAVNASLDEIFFNTAAGIEQAGTTLGRQEPPHPLPPDWVPWHLANIMMDIGVSASGTIGLLTGVGAAGVSIGWVQSKEALRSQGLISSDKVLPDHNGVKADLSLTDATTRIEIERLVDIVTNSVMVTGRVSNRFKLREGLLLAAMDLQSMMANINVYNDTYWDIGNFGLDIEVSASGAVYHGVTAGGGIRLRFEWRRVAYDSISAEPHDGHRLRRENLRVLLSNIARDLDAMDPALVLGSGFDIASLRVGIGLFLGANVGIVRGRIGVSGYASFNKRRVKANAAYRYDGRHPFLVLDELPLIDPQPLPEHMRYADGHSVRYEQVPDGTGLRERVVYYMNHEKFRAGLKKAVEIGAYFSDRAHRHSDIESAHKRWQIDYVNPVFSLSLEGAIIVATLSGRVSLDMQFSRI